MKNELLKVAPGSIAWQDYRSSNTGMVVFYATDPVSELPIREVPEEIQSDIIPEPNYETGTYGVYGCGKSKFRSAFAKAKLRYLLFVTKYAGTRAEYNDRVFITGFFRINKTADVKKLHIRYGSEYSCIDEQSCIALRADEVRFVPLEDAYEITDEVMKSWNYKAKITRQTRIILDEQQTTSIVEHLRSKPDITAQYISETKRLEPRDEEDENEPMEFEDYKEPIHYPQE
ncbi:MAG: hypothetical protein JW768_11450 [Chitinispirillaceae bacterium]|nr:hypothetical protein [Chitinispirillaceae bacterium]